MSYLIFINTGTILMLGLIHFYWACEGKCGIEFTIPEKYRASYFNPKHKTNIRIATIAVALGLIIMTVIVCSNYFAIDNVYTSIGTRVIGTIFLIRAIGDFNTCGMFKKICPSKFAKSDTFIFIPLCLFIGICSIIISF